jgi:hypothetical protein
MSRDPIVDEIRRIREQGAAKHNFDVDAILTAARKRQRRSKRKVISFVPKPQKLSA